MLGFPPAVERGAALQVRRPLTAVASLVQHGLEAHGLQQVQQAGSGVVQHGLEAHGLQQVQQAGSVVVARGF